MKPSIQRRPSLAHINAAVAALCLAPRTEQPGVIAEINAAIQTENNFSEALTTFSTGFRDTADLDAELLFLAPPVQVTERFEYAQANNKQAFDLDTDDARAAGSDFKQVEFTSEKVQAKTTNRGLQIVMEAKAYNAPGKAEAVVASLLRRIKRNALYRAAALISAAAVNAAKTWDTTAGKDPDMDVIAALVTAANKSGLKGNRVAFGDTAWSKRLLAHRAQNTAGGIASAGLKPEQVAGILGVEKVLHSNARFTSGAETKAEILANLVLMFFAQDFATEDDPSNVKGFWSPCDLSGERYAVYEWNIGSKLVGVAVEHNELTAITSNLGIAKLTIS